MLNGPSEVHGALSPKSESPTHFVVPECVNSKWRTPAQVIEGILYKHGQNVAKYPWIYIFACLFLTVICGLGFAAFRWENNIVRLWNPTNSETGQNFAWLWKNHPPDVRIHNLILFNNKDENVLNKESLLKLYDLRQSLYDAVSKDNVIWKHACLKVPLVPSQYSDFLAEPKPEYDDDDPFSDFNDGFVDDFQDSKVFDLSVEYYPEPYCSVFNSLENVCFEDSILELFAKNGQLSRDMIENLEDSDILKAINDKNAQYSGLFSVKKDFQRLLGGIEFDPQNGQVTKAIALKYDLYGKMNVTAAHLESIRKNSLLGDQLSLEQIDDNTRSIEDKFIEILSSFRSNAKNAGNLSLDFIVAKSFPDAVNDRISGDIPKVLGSFGLMFIYVTLALGKLNCTDNKSLLGLSGLFSVIMALVASYGVCSISGYFISPLHNFIPFLLLGLGVDDMFVIIQAFNQLPPLKDKNEIQEKIAVTLSNSGVAITVTSLTDLLAFVVGSTTTVPALKSFCIYCGLGIFVVYIFQITWFTAWLVIDQRRMLLNRNACLPCVKNCSSLDSISSPSSTSTSELKSRFSMDFMGKYGDFLSFKAVKVLVLAVTLGLFLASVYGNYMIEEEFDPWLFLDPKSYVSNFKATQDKYYPDKGESVLLFFSGPLNQHNLLSIDQLLARIRQDAGDLILSLDSWYEAFQTYFTANLGHEESDLLSEDNSKTHSALAQFLFSPSGGRYQYLFTFDGHLSCGQPLPPVYVSIIEFTHRHFNTSSEGILAMNTIKHLLRTSDFQGRLFPFSPMYSVWEIDEIIRGELYRNVCLATLAITIATFCLLSNFLGSCFVILAVFVTLTNVSGIIYFWGLNIDTVTCTVLIVCIGLSVDFSVHVIHAFLHSNGSLSKDLRVKSALKAIAPAVLNGGFSTLLAVILLMLSDVYVFVTFFKIFVLVVFFGLFNGLVFLPVLLSLIGPDAVPSSIANQEQDLNSMQSQHQPNHELTALNNGQQQTTD